MNIANIEVSGVQAVATGPAIIPAGIIGATVSFSFTDPQWDTLTKIAVFEGCDIRDVAMDGDMAVIPHETVAQEGGELRVGVYGVDAERNLAIPTLWTTLGKIQTGVDPSGDTSVDPTLPVWAELENRMEVLENNLDERVSASIEDYLKDNQIDDGTESDSTQKGAVLSINYIRPNLVGNVNLDAASVNAVPVSGGTMTGALNMNGQKISGLNYPDADDEAASKGYVDAGKVDKANVVNNFTTTEPGFVADARALKVLSDKNALSIYSNVDALTIMADDFNADQTSIKFYSFTSGITNGPNNATWFTCIRVSGMAIAFKSGKMYTNEYSGGSGVWGSWKTT